MPVRRLNQYPELARFVREDGQADRYQGLKINYVDHHNPDLMLFDEQGNELHRIDLTRLQTTDSMHKLMAMYGLKEICRDANPSCREWATSGECDANPVFMKSSCRVSCGLCSANATIDESAPCKDVSPASDCQYWSTMGQCDENQDFMHSNCAKSCGVCESQNVDKDEL
jgi:hypothetical protein